MPIRETYLLHLYRSRSVSGRQWAARLDRLTDGESLRFSDPEALLAHLQALVRALDESVPPTATPEGGDGPAPGPRLEEAREGV
jgi:hypothetical protein